MWNLRCRPIRDFIRDLMVHSQNEDTWSVRMNPEYKIKYIQDGLGEEGGEGWRRKGKAKQKQGRKKQYIYTHNIDPLIPSNADLRRLRTEIYANDTHDDNMLLALYGAEMR